MYACGIHVYDIQVHPSIHYLTPLILFRVRGWLEPIPGLIHCHVKYNYIIHPCINNTKPEFDLFWILWPCVPPLCQFLPCVSPSLCFSLRYLTCPLPSSLSSPVPDPLVSVSVYLVFVLPALLLRLFHHLS